MHTLRGHNSFITSFDFTNDGRYIQSNWQESFENICNIKVFKKLEEFKNGTLKELILQRLKQTALKIYMIES